MIFAETERLYLRRLERSELPRLTALIGAWDVTRWLSVVPFPYTLAHAEEFYDDLAPHYAAEAPEFYAVALKADNLLIGGIGLHLPRSTQYAAGEIEIGYWLGKPFWGQGLMSEAATKALALGFTRETTKSISATTSTTNHASQKILEKLGLRNQGEGPRDYKALRGENTVVRWLLTRDRYEKEKAV